jgi:hypothetical protein
MSNVERDPERGRAVAAELKKLGVKGVLIQEAEQGYITELACQMPECRCPEELGGRRHFEERTDDLSDWKEAWMPTHEHSPRPARDGGHRVVDNALLAHRLCNRIDYSIEIDRPHAKDLAKIEKAREEAIRRKSERS